MHHLTLAKKWFFRAKWAVNRAKYERGQIGDNVRVTPPKMLGLSEMSTRGEGWAVLRQNKLFWEKNAEERTATPLLIARV